MWVRLQATHLDGTRFDLAGDLGRFNDLAVPLPGAHQALNGAVATAALLLVREAAGIDEDALRTGLASTRWPGRLEPVRRHPLVLLDGAHNREGLAALLQALAMLVPGRPVTLVFGLLKEKESAFAAFRDLPPELVLRHVLAVTPPAGIRSLSSAETARRLRALGIPADPAVDLGDALVRAIEETSPHSPEGVVCVCGSLYLVGEARKRLRIQAGR